MQLTLDFTLRSLGAIKGHIKALQAELDYNPWHVAGSQRKWLFSSTLDGVESRYLLLAYETYLEGKKDEE